jgi:hypothetical protein
MMLAFGTRELQAQSQPQPAQSPEASRLKTRLRCPRHFQRLPHLVPLQAPPAHTFEAGPFGNYNVLVSGIGLWQGNPVLGDNSANGALEDGKFFLQKTTSWWQFYVSADAYNLLSLGNPFISTLHDWIVSSHGA